MPRRRNSRTWVPAGMILATSSTLFAASCSSSELQAFVTGLDVIFTALDAGNDDDISFGDWLLSELND